MRALSRRRGGFDVWPGFVDALTSLIMVLVFLLLIFAVGQAVLSDTLSLKTRALEAVNAQVAELARALSLNEGELRAQTARADGLTESLRQATEERDRLRASAEGAAGRETTLNADVVALTELKHQLEVEIARLLAESETGKQELGRQTEANAAATAQIELLSRQAATLREQLGELAQALELANRDVKAKEGTIADLGQQLNLALANKVGKLERYRSEFFGRLREALGSRGDVRVVGDRFVVPTDILFGSGSAELDEAAQGGLAQLAATLRQLSDKIPGDIDWVLRIDGHTDRAPIHNERFPSNWELSTARAVAIVKYLASEGIPPERLAANGFGEFQPIDNGLSLAAYARNRRIELQLTNR